MKTKKRTQPRPKAGLSVRFDRILWYDHIQKTVAELGQSVEHLIAEREVAGSIPETETTLMVL